MKEVYSSYELQINGRNDGKLTINGDDIDYNVDVETAVKRHMKNSIQSFHFQSYLKTMIQR